MTIPTYLQRLQAASTAIDAIEEKYLDQEIFECEPARSNEIEAACAAHGVTFAAVDEYIYGG